ncbi:MAG: MarR family transcriptional regulator [Clostridia bacterium]|nr:MarR family transcriptional regulator [Clostridia bacterium]MDE6472359.1 MarR family transcriptional regulator [Clostridia bacterium]
MADIKDVEYVFKRLNETRPAELDDRMSDINFGIGAVLKILDESGGAVTCGEIAKKMKVSTARVAVLLKKMEAKNLIERSSDKDDARIVYINITTDGKALVDEIRNIMTEHLARIIDELGMDKIKTFLDLSAEIKSVAEATRPQMPKFFKKNSK